MKFDHIGYAVKDMVKARKALETLGYLFEDTITDNMRNIYISFGTKDSLRIELVSPISSGSPVDDLLRRMGGGIPYHICYQAVSLDEELERLKSVGYKMITPPEPACAFHGRKVVFLFHLAIGIIELVEKTGDDKKNDQESVCLYAAGGGTQQNNI